jgi:hypothetical protein
VRRTLFACRSCWCRLPRELREPITDSHLLNRAAHLAAMAAACDWYRAHPLSTDAPTESAVGSERCELTELLVDQCAHCVGTGGIERELLEQRARLLASPRWVPARYPGDCDVCGDRFEAGAAIRKSGHGWRAECCAGAGGVDRG